MPNPSSKPQHFANHRAIPPVVFALSGVAILTWAGFNLWHAVQVPSCGAWLAAVGTTALLPTWFYARRSAQVVQDRVIRLEMQVRFARLLPTTDLSKLTLPQVIALRFAADHELPALTTRVLAGELKTPDEIKRAITTWQADWLRV